MITYIDTPYHKGKIAIDTYLDSDHKASMSFMSDKVPAIGSTVNFKDCSWSVVSYERSIFNEAVVNVELEKDK